MANIETQKPIFYAYEGGITTDPDKGKVEITFEQYRQASQEMLEGKIVTVKNGIFEIVQYEPPQFIQYIVEGKLDQTYGELPEGAELYTADDWYIDDSGKYLKKDEQYELIVKKQALLADLEQIDAMVSARTVREAMLGDAFAMEIVKDAEQRAEELRKKLAELE